MIIWINGAFGSGKSTIAELLHSKIELSHIYDSEQVGYFLGDSFPTEMNVKIHGRNSRLIDVYKPLKVTLTVKKSIRII
ncbi:hypothetical protein [Clostridium sp.]|uniref:hypothetical protein n=1 Tax=Clostridium sp. TaxID=1506 RepID=UPI002846B679|nr:hypothetical protein [Clostridium sp.]MDR3598044.1 hypothetical protein [Clostridium sp.]